MSQTNFNISFETSFSQKSGHSTKINTSAVYTENKSSPVFVLDSIIKLLDDEQNYALSKQKIIDLKTVLHESTRVFKNEFSVYMNEIYNGLINTINSINLGTYTGDIDHINGVFIEDDVSSYFKLIDFILFLYNQSANLENIPNETQKNNNLVKSIIPNNKSLNRKMSNRQNIQSVHSSGYNLRIDNVMKIFFTYYENKINVTGQIDETNSSVNGNILIEENLSEKYIHVEYNNIFITIKILNDEITVYKTNDISVVIESNMGEYKLVENNITFIINNIMEHISIEILDGNITTVLVEVEKTLPIIKNILSDKKVTIENNSDSSFTISNIFDDGTVKTLNYQTVSEEKNKIHSNSISKLMVIIKLIKNIYMTASISTDTMLTNNNNIMWNGSKTSSGDKNIVRKKMPSLWELKSRSESLNENNKILSKNENTIKEGISKIVSAVTSYSNNQGFNKPQDMDILTKTTNSNSLYTPTSISSSETIANNSNSVLDQLANGNIINNLNRNGNSRTRLFNRNVLSSKRNGSSKELTEEQKSKILTEINSRIELKEKMLVNLTANYTKKINSGTVSSQETNNFISSSSFIKADLEKLKNDKSYVESQKFKKSSSTRARNFFGRGRIINAIRETTNGAEYTDCIDSATKKLLKSEMSKLKINNIDTSSSSGNFIGLLSSLNIDSFTSSEKINVNSHGTFNDESFSFTFVLGLKQFEMYSTNMFLYLSTLTPTNSKNEYNKFLMFIFTFLTFVILKNNKSPKNNINDEIFNSINQKNMESIMNDFEVEREFLTDDNKALLSESINFDMIKKIFAGKGNFENKTIKMQNPLVSFIKILMDRK